MTEFRGFLGSARRGSIRAGTYVLLGGVYGAELRALIARGGRVVISAGMGPKADALRRELGPQTIHVYRDAHPGYQHLKYVLCNTSRGAAYRFSTGAMATIDLKILAIGAKGLGRTELFFQTTHPGICREGREVADALEHDATPPSGRYLLLQTTGRDDLLPRMIRDLRALPPEGVVVHVRASIDTEGGTCEGSMGALEEWHAALEARSRTGRVYVASDSRDEWTRRALRRFEQAGARVGAARLFPGSDHLPRELLEAPVGRWFRRRSAQEHFNVTLLRHPSGDAIVYLGSKRDAPHVPGAVDGLLRLESTEFPGLAEGLDALVHRRFRFPDRRAR